MSKLDPEFVAEYARYKARMLRNLTDRVVLYHPALARIAGGATHGLFLSQLVYWDGKGYDPDGWIYKTQGEWTRETQLTISQQQSARRRLCQIGLLDERRVGLPARLYYRLNLERLADLLTALHAADRAAVPAFEDEESAIA